MVYNSLIKDITKYNLSNDSSLNGSLDSNKLKENGVEPNLIEKVLSEKTDKIKDTIRLIWILINEREEIKRKVIDGLDSQILRAKNKILKAEPMISSYTRLTHVQADLEREIFKLEKVKLDEEVICWRDVLGLKKQLIGLKEKLKFAKNKKNLCKR